MTGMSDVCAGRGGMTGMSDVCAGRGGMMGISSLLVNYLMLCSH